MRKGYGCVFLAGALASGLACSHMGNGSEKSDRSQPASGETSRTTASSATSSGWSSSPLGRSGTKEKDKDKDDAFPETPREPFTDGQRAFVTVKDALLSHYYETGITEDDVYRAAAQGVLEHVDPKMHKWNKLLSPPEVSELRSDVKGEFVGIGVRIDVDEGTGHAEILGVIPGSPAEKAGLEVGDLVVSVNGKVHKGEPGNAMISEIRGKPGEAVALTVLRDDKLLPFSILRAVVQVGEVAHAAFGDVGYVQIHGFSAKTPSMLRAGLDELAKPAPPRAIVVDLRGNQGGSFDGAVAAAEQFLPPGQTIVTLVRRGGKEESIQAKGTAFLPNAPILVLVDHDTSSGGELLAAALRDVRGARLVGTKTFGKWSVQEIADLPNGYAFKYTTSIFRSPGGKNFEAEGLTPDVEVEMPDDRLERARSMSDPEKRLVADVQLRTAVAILRR